MYDAKTRSHNPEISIEILDQCKELIQDHLDQVNPELYTELGLLRDHFIEERQAFYKYKEINPDSVEAEIFGIDDDDSDREIDFREVVSDDEDDVCEWGYVYIDDGNFDDWEGRLE